MIRVLLADDQALVRAGFRALLEAEPDIDVVGEAGNGEEAVQLATSLVPDVVLMDIRMPGPDGLEATRRIIADERLAEVRIIILTTFDLDEYVFEALRLGASGFLVKDTEPLDLLRGVRAVAGELRKRILAAFSREGLAVPFPHQVIVTRGPETPAPNEGGHGAPEDEGADPTAPVGTEP